MVPGWVAQWATVAAFLGSIFGIAFGVYQWRVASRRDRQNQDDELEMKSNRQARMEFKLEDHAAKLEEHDDRIGKLERGK